MIEFPKTPMTTAERHDRILVAIGGRPVLSLREAIGLTGASEPTVRRDFGALARSGLARRVRGGLRAVDTGPIPPFALREVTHAPQKRRIARHAAGLLSAGDVVFIDGGTTTYQLATCLPPVPLRVITNSLRLAAVLDERAQSRPGLEVFLTGGQLYPASGLLVGPGAVVSVDQYRADWAFLSVSGLTAHGLFNSTEPVVETERRMIANADRAVVLADSSKLGRHAMCHVCGLDQVDVLLTDRTPDAEIGEAVGRGGGEVVVAG